MSEIVPIQNSKVAYTVIDEQAVLVHPQDSSMYWLNPVSSLIWELSDGQRSAHEIAGLLCEDFDVNQETALRDTTQMIDTFVTKQLFEWVEVS